MILNFSEFLLNEAKIMDPNQRILLETSYNAIEDSGYSTEYFNNKKVGCYTGCPAEYTSKSYQNLLIDISPELADNHLQEIWQQCCPRVYLIF